MDILRTLAILFVICHHLTLSISNLLGLSDSSINLFSYQTIIGEFLNCFFIIGVNIFFLLSGYFGIKLHKGKLLSLIIKVYFYFIVSGIIMISIGKLNTGSVVETMKYFLGARNHFWFVNAYIFLFFISPFLNLLAERLDQTHIPYFILISLFLFCFWLFLGNSGDSWGMNGGYSPLWGSVLYLYGRIIRRKSEKLNQSKIFWSISYLSFTLLNFICVLFVTLGLKKSVLAWKLFNYNNPLILASSISLFMFFVNLKGNNKKSSSLFSIFSTHSLGVYVIHTVISYDFLISLVSSFPYKLLLFLPNAIMILIACTIIDILYDLTLGKLFGKLSIFIENFIVKVYLLATHGLKKIFCPARKT